MAVAVGGAAIAASGKNSLAGAEVPASGAAAFPWLLSKLQNSEKVAKLAQTNPATNSQAQGDRLLKPLIA